MISFDFLDKKRIDDIFPDIFKILYSNMSLIVPTGNSYEEDYTLWYHAVSPAIKKDNRQILLIYDDGLIVGFFQYYVNESVFMMEEIQIVKNYHGTGIFRQLFHNLCQIVPHNTPYVEAYAHKSNIKSQNILEYLGLEIIEENKNGNSYHFRGNYNKVFEKYK